MPIIDNLPNFLSQRHCAGRCSRLFDLRDGDYGSVEDKMSGKISGFCAERAEDYFFSMPYARIVDHSLL